MYPESASPEENHQMLDMESSNYSTSVSYHNIDSSFIRNLEQNESLDKNSNHRVIIIEKFASCGDGLCYLIKQNFKKFFKKLPFAFVVVLKCKSSSFGGYKNVKINLASNFSSNRPLIVVFETDADTSTQTNGESDNFLVLFKHYGPSRSFSSVDLGFTDESSITNFGALMKSLENGICGYNYGSFEEITVNGNEAIQNLMNAFASNKDLLGIRFLHLFDPKLRPSNQHIETLMRHDNFTSTKLDVFCALFDYSINHAESYNRQLETHSIQHDDCRILDLQFNDRKENLLMLAVRCKNKEVVDFLLKSGINADVMNSNFETAADLAFSSKYYDILTLLLLANSRYPHLFAKPMICGKQLSDLIATTEEFHKLIETVEWTNDVNDMSTFSKIDQFLVKYPQLEYWYDTKNQSVVTRSILKKTFYVYNYLVTRQMYMGPFEDVSAIKEHLSENEKIIISEINEKNVRKIPSDHILVLRQNSRMWPSSRHQLTKLEFGNLVEKSFKELDKNIYLHIILKCVAAHPNFRIIFDFNRTSVEAVDFTSSDSTRGVFYNRSMHIYIGALELTDEENYDSALGVLAHELTHFAMMLTFGNSCRPYLNGQDSDFEAIYSECKKKMLFEPLIDLVFTYKSIYHHAELIVRVPHLMIQYRNKPEYLKFIEEKFENLFDFFKNIVTKEVDSGINQISGDFNEELKMECGVWEKRLERQKIVNYSFGIGIFGLITIVFFLLRILWTYEDCFNSDKACVWNELMDKTKTNLLNTFIDYPNMTLRDVVDGNDDVLGSLNDFQIRNTKKISLNKQNLTLDFDYFERMLAKSDADYLYHFNNPSCRMAYKSSAIKSFEEARNSGRIKLISGNDPLAGVTALFKHNREVLFTNNPRIWTVYIDFGTKNVALETFQNWSQEIVLKFLIDMIGYKAKAFETELFKKKFAKGDVILFLDHIDSFLAMNKELATKFLESLIEFSHNNTEIWIGTRKASSDDIKANIKSKSPSFNSHFKLHPLYCDNRTKFINEAVNSSDLNETQKIEAITRINELFKDVLEKWRSQQTFPVDNICLLRIIADHTVESVRSNTTDVSLFKIYKEYVSEISRKDAFMGSHELILMAIGLRMKFNKNVKDIYIDELIKHSTVYADDNDILINSTWNFNNRLIKTGIRIGLLLDDKKDDLKFLHQIILEYYLANYLKVSIWHSLIEPTTDNEIFRMKLRLLFMIYMDPNFEFPVVQRLIEEAVEEMQTQMISNYDETFRKVFKEEFEKAFNKTDINVERELTKLFRNDPKMTTLIKECTNNQLTKLKRNSQKYE